MRKWKEGARKGKVGRREEEGIIMEGRMEEDKEKNDRG